MTGHTGGKRMRSRMWPAPLLFLFWLIAGCGQSFDERMAEEARRYTGRQCPRKLDEGSRLDSLTYDVRSRTLTRWITLYGVLDDSLTLQRIERETPWLRNYLLGQTEADADLQEARRHGVSFRFIYRSAGRTAFRQEIILTPDDYRREN